MINIMIDIRYISRCVIQISKSVRFILHVRIRQQILLRCFSCGGLTHTMDQCRTLDESFPFFAYGMAGRTHRRPVHPGTGSSSESPGPADGKRRLIRGEGLVTRISNDYRPQLPVVWKDIPRPAVPCHVGTARLLQTVNNRTRSIESAVGRPYLDSEESDNDVKYAEEYDSTVQQVGRWNDWLTQTANDSCGEGCAQLDDFKWFLLADEQAGELIAPESTHLHTETTAQQLQCPPVVAQTRPMEGCSPVLPRRLRRGHDVLTEDGAVAVDTRQVSAALKTVVSREIHRKSECVLTVVPTLAAAPQAASEVVEPRPRDYGCTDSLPPVGECLESLDIDPPDAGESEIEVAGGSPPADIDISGSPDVLRTAISVTTVVSGKSMEIDTPDAVVSGMEVAGRSPPADIDISRGPDVLQTALSVTTVVSEEWMCSK